MRANAEKWNLDLGRIGATGNSSGAHLSVMLGLCPPEAGLEGDGPYQEYSSAVQAVATSTTTTHFALNPNRKYFLGMGQELSDKLSPTSCVSAEAPPIMLFHELSDPAVHVAQTDTLINGLREAGAKDVNYLLLGDGSGHGVFGRSASLLEPVREAFFERTLRAPQ